MSNHIKNISQQTNDQKMQQASTDIDEISNNLIDVGYPELQVAEFQQYFLPLFMGILNPDDARVAMDAWVSRVSGNPSVPVNLIDQGGNTVITVPPLIDTATFNIDSDTGSFSSIFYLYSMENNNMPTVAMNNLNKSLNEKLSQVQNIASPGDNQWIRLYQYFGVLDQVPGQQEKLPVKSLDEDSSALNNMLG